MMNLRIVCLLALVCALTGRAEDVAVTATGRGDSYRAAVNDALVSALEQRNGVAVSTDEHASLVAKAKAVSTAGSGSESRQEVEDSINRGLKKWSDGKISGYTVLADSQDGDGYRVTVEVRFPGPYVLGLDPANRRRMAVVAFRPQRATFTWYGQTVSALDFTSALADKMNVALTQTRKFTVVDRMFDAEVENELKRLTSANASNADAVRQKQSLGTDYLVVGDVAFRDVRAPGVHPVTGQPLPATSQIFAEITYRVLLAPTGQLKWTDVVRLDAVALPAGDPASFVSAAAEAAAIQVVDTMMSNILPFEVVSLTAGGQIVIGEGGKSLAPGERLTVFTLGEEVRDSRTGEVLDRIEEPVGTVEVVRVAAKVSYARVVEGDASKICAGCRLRRVPVLPPPAPVPAAPATSVRPVGNGGVVTPF